MFRKRKLLRDRAAGMVFDWRRGHGTTYRLLFAAVVSASFWGALFGYVQIRQTKSIPLVDAPIDLTVVNLDSPQNRWLAEIMDREALFHERWDVSASRALDREIERASGSLKVAPYVPRLSEIPPFLPRPSLINLPDRGPGSLPPPEEVAPVIFASPPVDWWVEFRAIDGAPNWGGFSFRWPDQKAALSEGETWTVLIGLDWQGGIVTSTAWEDAADPRTPFILEKVRESNFPRLPKEGPLRWVKIEARIYNQSVRN